MCERESGGWVEKDIERAGSEKEGRERELAREGGRRGREGGRGRAREREREKEEENEKEKVKATETEIEKENEKEREKQERKGVDGSILCEGY